MRLTRCPLRGVYKYQWWLVYTTNLMMFTWCHLCHLKGSIHKKKYGYLKLCPSKFCEFCKFCEVCNLCEFCKFCELYEFCNVHGTHRTHSTRRTRRTHSLAIFTELTELTELAKLTELAEFTELAHDTTIMFHVWLKTKCVNNKVVLILNPL